MVPALMKMILLIFLNLSIPARGMKGEGYILYIAKQLLERSEYSIELMKTKSNKQLSGANFIVNFFVGDK